NRAFESNCGVQAFSKNLHLNLKRSHCVNSAGVRHAVERIKAVRLKYARRQPCWLRFPGGSSKMKRNKLVLLSLFTFAFLAFVLSAPVTFVSAQKNGDGGGA